MGRKLLGGALALFLFVGSASALTLVLDFTTTDTDIFGETTGAADFTPFAFAGLGSDAAIQAALLGVVQDHYLDYPTVGVDPLSPLPVGMELDIDFEIGTVGIAPTNGDAEYYFIKVGTGLAGSNAVNAGILGAACLSCVRNAAGAGPNFGVANGAIVGSVWTDHIAGILGSFGALTDPNRLNLIGGTTSHEIGHTVSLPHANTPGPNPGASTHGVMGSGATGMPISQRILDREFTYLNFAQLIDAIGLRDVRDPVVPEPSSFVLAGLGLAGLGLVRRRRRKAA